MTKLTENTWRSWKNCKNWIKNLINWYYVHALTRCFYFYWIKYYDKTRNHNKLKKIHWNDALNISLDAGVDIYGIFVAYYLTFSPYFQLNSLLFISYYCCLLWVRSDERWSWTRKNWKTLWPNWVIDLERAWHESNFSNIKHTFLSLTFSFFQHIFHFQFFFIFLLLLVYSGIQMKRKTFKNMRERMNLKFECVGGVKFFDKLPFNVIFWQLTRFSSLHKFTENCGNVNKSFYFGVFLISWNFSPEKISKIIL